MEIHVYPLPLHQIVAVSACIAGVAWVIARRRGLRNTYWGRVAAATLCLVILSASLRHSRHAGTGELTTYGWPKPVYTVVRYPENGSVHSGVVWRGIVENLLFYGAIALLGASITSGRRASSSRFP